MHREDEERSAAWLAQDGGISTCQAKQEALPCFKGWHLLSCGLATHVAHAWLSLGSQTEHKSVDGRADYAGKDAAMRQ